MSMKKIRSSAATLAQSILECMTGVRQNIPKGASIYAVALVVSDDFDSLAVYANTDLHLAKSKGRALDKWYFGQFWSEGMGVESHSLVDQLGEVEDSDEKPATGNAADWLAAMTDAMRTAKLNGAFASSGKEPFLFCSMIDSLNAVWLEDCSAKFLNAADSYAAVAPELSAAAKEWYIEDDDEEDGDIEEGREAFKTAYKNILSQLGRTT